MSICDSFSAEAASWGIVLPPDMLDALEYFGRSLQRANRVMNLTSVCNDEGIAVRHFLDSLRPLVHEWIPKEASLVDIGTGPGFPGLPLAIVRPDLKVTLTDSIAKKADFLAHVVRDLGIDHRVQVLCCRAEDLGQDPSFREKYDIACARAVASLPILAEYLLPLVRLSGSMLAWKGPSLPDELTKARRALAILGGSAETTDHYFLDRQELALLRIIKTAPTPPAYPRKNGKPSKTPL